MHLLMCTHIAGVYPKKEAAGLLAILSLLWKGDLKAGQLGTEPVGGFSIVYLFYFVK